MGSLCNPPAYDDIPPPAYHDGRVVDQFPIHHEGYHPYGRRRPSLFQRLLFSPCGRGFDYPLDPATDLNAGVRVGAGSGSTRRASVDAGENSNAPIPHLSSGAEPGPLEGAAASHGVLNFLTQAKKPTTSTFRPAKRKRDDLEGEGDSN